MRKKFRVWEYITKEYEVEVEAVSEEEFASWMDRLAENSGSEKGYLQAQEWIDAMLPEGSVISKRLVEESLLPCEI